MLQQSMVESNLLRNVSANTSCPIKEIRGSDIHIPWIPEEKREPMGINAIQQGLIQIPTNESNLPIISSKSLQLSPGNLLVLYVGPDNNQRSTWIITEVPNKKPTLADMLPPIRISVIEVENGVLQTISVRSGPNQLLKPLSIVRDAEEDTDTIPTPNLTMSRNKEPAPITIRKSNSKAYGYVVELGQKVRCLCESQSKEKVLEEDKIYKALEEIIGGLNTYCQDN